MNPLIEPSYTFGSKLPSYLEEDAEVAFASRDGFAVDPAVEAILIRCRNNNSQADSWLPNPNSRVQPDVTLLPGSPARCVGATPPADGFFDQVDYAGGVDRTIPGSTTVGRASARAEAPCYRGKAR